MALAGVEAEITEVLARGKNVYAFCSTRRDAEILDAHFRNMNPVLYDSYTKGQPRPDNVLQDQKLTDSQLFIATGAANVGISILDPNAYTTVLPTLNHGSLQLNDTVQFNNRDRYQCGGSIHLPEYNFALPVKPSENTQVSIFHEAMKIAEEKYVNLPTDAVKKIAAADALLKLADTQPETYLKYHLGEVAQKLLVFQDAELPSAEQTEQIRVTRSALLALEQKVKTEGAIEIISEGTVFTSDGIRKLSNEGKIDKHTRLAQEHANLALQNAGWWDDPMEPPNDEISMMAIRLINAGVPIDGLAQLRRGFLAAQFPQWVAHEFIAAREFAHRDLTEKGQGVEITAVDDDRFIGKLVKALLDAIAGVPWTAEGLAGAVREVLNRKVKLEGYNGKTFIVSLLSGAAGPKVYKASRFLNILDDAGVIDWAKHLIETWYPAKLAKRGDAYGLKMHDAYALIVQCFQLYAAEHPRPPDRWVLHEFATVELPDPNAAAIAKAREMRANNTAIADIATELDFNISTISRWCKGIDPKAKLKAQARQMEKDGMKRKDIVAKLGIPAKTLRRWIGKKGT